MKNCGLNFIFFLRSFDGKQASVVKGLPVLLRNAQSKPCASSGNLSLAFWKDFRWMSSTHSGHSSYCASFREHKKIYGFHRASGPVGWIQHPFVLKLVGFLFFPFCLHHLQLKVAPVLSCLSKNFQRSCNQRGWNVFFRPHFLNRGGYLMQVQMIESDIFCMKHR